MAAITQTIAIVDKSNKVVSTSKQLKNVFKEAKMAYLERKAEIMAERRQKEDKELRKALKAASIADDETESRASSRSHSRRHHHSSKSQHDRPHHNRRPSLQDHRYSSSRSVHSARSSRSSLSESPRSPRSHHTPLGQFNEDLAHARSAPSSPVAKRSNSLVRRATDLPLTTTHPKPIQRSFSHHDLDDHIDMDLAYGEFHPEHHDLSLRPDVEEKLQKQELASLVTKVKMLLDEANCAQHSVKAIVVHLQKNPDAMAAVALTLAEISNIASKMAPAALATLKTGAPTVFAMLAAPEFLIAVGVGVGLTVVMFGGYKIVKKITQANKKQEESMDEMLDVQELSRIEVWRRGIADTDADNASVVSGATSVEGEFITPMAARSMGHLPNEGRSRKSKKDKDGKSRDKKEKKSKKDREGSEVGSEASRRSSSSKNKENASSALGTRVGTLKDSALIKVKKPSPLRRMFRSGETNSTAS
jgi:hypothetical protein